MAKTLLRPVELIESRLYLAAILNYYGMQELATTLGYTRASIYYWASGERKMSLESLTNLKTLCQRTLTGTELENISVHKRDHRKFITRLKIKRREGEVYLSPI